MKMVNINDLIEEVARRDTTDGTVKVFSGKEIISILQELPFAQIEPHYDEWCTDCKEHDSKKHCCPRFNRVIRNALKDAQSVIRCKDCKHRFTEGENVIHNVCELNHNKVQPDDWFCADAERRGEEDEDE